MSDAQSINVDDFRTAANELRKAYGHHNAVCTSTDLLLRALAKIESDAKVIAGLREAVQLAKDDLERVAVDDDEFVFTLAAINAALQMVDEQTAGESK